MLDLKIFLNIFYDFGKIFLKIAFFHQKRIYFLVRAGGCGLRADAGWQKGLRAAGWRAAGPARIHPYTQLGL